MYQVHISQEGAEGEKGAENRSNSMEKLKEKGREHVGGGLIVDWNSMVVRYSVDAHMPWSLLILTLLMCVSSRCRAGGRSHRKRV